MAQQCVDYNQSYHSALKNGVDRLRQNSRKIGKGSDQQPRVEIVTFRCGFSQFDVGILLSMPNEQGKSINLLVPFYKFSEMVQSGYVVMNHHDVNPNSHLHVPAEVWESLKGAHKPTAKERGHKRDTKYPRPHEDSKPAKRTKTTATDILQQGVDHMSVFDMIQQPM